MQTIDKQKELLNQLREETNQLSRTIYTYCEATGSIPGEALVDSSIYLLKLAAFCSNEIKRLAGRQNQVTQPKQRELVLSIK